MICESLAILRDSTEGVWVVWVQEDGIEHLNVLLRYPPLAILPRLLLFLLNDYSPVWEIVLFHLLILFLGLLILLLTRLFVVFHGSHVMALTPVFDALVFLIISFSQWHLIFTLNLDHVHVFIMLFHRFRSLLIILLIHLSFVDFHFVPSMSLKLFLVVL